MAKLVKEKESKKSLIEKVKENRFYKHVMSFTNSLGEDHISSYSSEAALFTIISFFPFLMLFFIIVSFTPLTPAFIMRLINYSFPLEIKEIFITVVEQLNNTSKTVISFTAITALWTASRGFMAIVKGFNVIYKTENTKSSIVNRIYSLFYTIGFAILLALTLVLLVFGNMIYLWIIKHFPFIQDLAILVMGMRATVLLGFLFFFFLIMYIVMPNRKSRVIYEFPGALLASLGWVGFSYGFSFYIDNMANFSYMYGSLAAIVLLLLWVYFCMYILFIGAELNHKSRNYFTQKLAVKVIKRKKSGETNKKHKIIAYLGKDLFKENSNKKNNTTNNK